MPLQYNKDPTLHLRWGKYSWALSTRGGLHSTAMLSVGMTGREDLDPVSVSLGIALELVPLSFPKSLELTLFSMTFSLFALLYTFTYALLFLSQAL